MKKERKPPKEPAYPLPPFKILHIAHNTLDKVPWFVYKVSVDDDGEISWNGISGVHKEGRRVWAISKEAVALLNFMLTKYDFLGFPGNPPEELPGIDGNQYAPSDDYLITVIFKDGSRKQGYVNGLEESDEEGTDEPKREFAKFLEFIMGVTTAWPPGPLAE